MARKVPATVVLAMQEHRLRLQGTLARGSARRLKGLYDDAQGALTARLRRTVGRGDTFTAHQQRMALAQVREGQAVISRRLAGTLREETRGAQEASLRGLADDIGRLHRRFTGSEIVLPIEEAARFRGVIDRRGTSLLRMHRTSMARYGARIVEEVEGELALSLLSAEAPAAAMDRVAEAIDGAWWQGERIVRTETAWAFSATARDGIVESAGELDGLMQQWVEHCDDEGRPLDDRVGVDSIALHQQVAPAGGLFTMPAEAPHPDARGQTKVHASLVGKAWPFPPNRPNDRSSLSPWMASWGVPGWRYVGGRRARM